MSTPFDLHGKTAAVTGGGRGLGLGISSALLEAGADVIIFGRNPVEAELKARAEALGRQVHFVKLDLADSEAIASAAQLVLSTHQVDILVNNAGTQDRSPRSTSRCRQGPRSGHQPACGVPAVPALRRSDAGSR